MCVIPPAPTPSAPRPLPDMRPSSRCSWSAAPTPYFGRSRARHLYMPPVEAGGTRRRLLAKHVARDKALSQLPGVVDHLTAPIQTGDLLFAAVAAGARRGQRGLRRAIDAAVRDCQARLYPKDPRASAKPRAAASRRGTTGRLDDRRREIKPVNDQTARAKPRGQADDYYKELDVVEPRPRFGSGDALRALRPHRQGRAG